MNEQECELAMGIEWEQVGQWRNSEDPRDSWPGPGTPYFFNRVSTLVRECVRSLKN